MLVPDHFRAHGTDEALAVARRWPFALVASTPADGGAPLAAHLPVLVEDVLVEDVVADDAPGEDRWRLLSHLARSNPQVALLRDGAPTLVAFSGPHGYVSPTWYGSDEPTTPTWNHVSVHVRGTPRLLEAEEVLLDVLQRTVDAMEDAHPGRPWRMDARTDYVRGLARGVVAFAVDVEQVDATVKLSQNQPAHLRERVVSGLRGRARDLDLPLADAMRACLDERGPRTG